MAPISSTSRKAAMLCCGNTCSGSSAILGSMSSFCPPCGIVSDALPTFCRRPLVGYAIVALSTVATMLIGFEVWVHHMFATGLPTLALSFFGAASMIISIPSSVAVFAWIATIWT